MNRLERKQRSRTTQKFASQQVPKDSSPVNTYNEQSLLAVEMANVEYGRIMSTKTDLLDKKQKTTIETDQDVDPPQYLGGAHSDYGGSLSTKQLPV